MKTPERILQSAMHQNMAKSFLQSPAGISFDSCNDDVFLGLNLIIGYIIVKIKGYLFLKKQL